METPYRKIVADGLWNNNPGLVQLLGLCPLLAVSNTAVNALSLGVATLFVMLMTNVVVSMIRDWVKPEIRLPVYVMLIAAIVTAVELAMNAYMHDLYKVLGIFVALITTNCVVIARAESFASKHDIKSAALDGAMMGLGALIVLFVLGSLREIIGQGTWMSGIDKVLGPSFSFLSLRVLDDYHGFLLAILPPGAFILLGFMIAFKKFVDNRIDKLKVKVEKQEPEVSGLPASN